MLIFDEEGNLYVYYSNEFMRESYDFMDLFPEYMHTDFLFMEKEKYERLSKYEITISQDKDTDVSYVRRPYYRMRGKPVSKEQAFDIIRRTDNFLGWIKEIEKHEDFVGNINFDNWLIHKNHYPRGYGWIHTDGKVGTNAITQKYPTIKEFVCEWLKYMIAFPYLDVVVALTWWNEVHPGNFMIEDDSNIDYEAEEYDQDFYDAIVMGIYVHNHKLEILNKTDTVKKYKEYDSLYGKEREKFKSDYYHKNHIEQVDLVYLKKCIESYGLDADEILSKQNRYEWDSLWQNV